jgi:hypothetical protein
VLYGPRGDEFVYHERTNQFRRAVSKDNETYTYTLGYISSGKAQLSWEAPVKKRTFMLNGVELPCPLSEEHANKMFCTYAVTVGALNYHFEHQEDYLTVNAALAKILAEARDQ